MQPTENTNKILTFIAEKYKTSELTDDSLVLICELCFDLLNLKTISDYAKENNKTYAGVKKFSKNIISINNHKFIKDNE